MSFPNIVYYINLKHRTDRKQHIEKELKKVGISNYIRFDAIYDEEGWRGCTNSHIQILEKFIESDLNTCLILEDDFYFVDYDQSKKILSEFSELDIDWDIVLLTCNCKETNPTNINYLVKPNMLAMTTAGYIVNKKFAKVLCENFKKSIEASEPLDVYWKILQTDEKYNWYIFEPRLGRQLKGYSDIQKKYVNYKKYL